MLMTHTAPSITSARTSVEVAFTTSPITPSPSLLLPREWFNQGKDNLRRNVTQARVQQIKALDTVVISWSSKQPINNH